MPAKKYPRGSSAAAMAHLNALLDEALEQTFPASDPVAISIEVDVAALNVRPQSFRHGIAATPPHVAPFKYMS